jgi:CRISPR-associated protein Csm3
LVRDAHLEEASITEEMKKNLASEWTEEKMENSIDRITSAATPRTLERVPKGARFEFQIVFTLLQQSDRDLLAALLLAMQLLEDDYLGAWGSRGSGQVCFEEIQVFWNSRQTYKDGPIDLSQKQPVLNKLFHHLTHLREQQSGIIAALG